jgi:2-oxoisovalerate dehydrogenase E1 component subunit alpha
VQNNQYAISVPVAKQSHARTFADRAIGYGMPGYFVDGNDAAAMFAVLSAAVERARAGGGPSLIEGLTYRVEAHTNSDDPTRYRSKAEEVEWKTRDPLARLQTYLTGAAILTAEIAKDIAVEAEALATTTRDAMNEAPMLDPLELFDHVYVNERPALREQREFLSRELAATELGNAS